MANWTLRQIITKIEQDIDTEDETFIQPTEMFGYVNEAVREAEAEIHKLGTEDEYFLSSATINLINGTAIYALPSDIYGSKIRAIVYNNGSEIYYVRRLRNQYKFTAFADINTFPGSRPAYKYILKNVSAAAGTTIVLTPPSQETSTNMTLWYIRNANELTTDLDQCDIPEFVNFIMQYVKVRIYEKEGNPSLQKAVADLQAQRQLMVATLTDQTADDDNIVEMDLSHYEEST